MLGSLDAPAREPASASAASASAASAASALCVAFACLYLGGQLASCEWAVALGSLAEWALLHTPLWILA